jgi:hypothetical protein
MPDQHVLVEGEIGWDVCGNYPDHHGPSRSAPKRNQSARGNPRGGPKYSHTQLGRQQQAQTCRQEIGKADRDGERNRPDPLPHRTPVSQDLALDLLR